MISGATEEELIIANDRANILLKIRELENINDKLSSALNSAENKINQLTNNWNELRQHIKEYLEEWENNDDEWVKGKCDMARDILYDMEEIKEGNNVSSRD